MAVLKAGVTGLAEVYLYSIPWIGGFLRSIELVEISNLLVFALLAGGIGAATFYLPDQWNTWVKMGLLLAVSPFVFSASYMMQQHLWIQRVATRADISYEEARSLTNAFLERESGGGGFFGFYPFSTEVAELPTRRQDLESEQRGNPSKLLAQELSSYQDPKADIVAYVFERVGWLIRFMYMIVAALTGLIYYFKGQEWADDRRRASLEADPQAKIKVNPPRKRQLPPQPPLDK